MDIAWRKVEHLDVIAPKSESYLRIDQHYALESSNDVVQLGRVRLKELAAGRNIEEQILDKEVAAFLTRARFLTCNTTGRDRQMGSNLLTTKTCLQLNL